MVAVAVAVMNESAMMMIECVVVAAAWCCSVMMAVVVAGGSASDAAVAVVMMLMAVMSDGVVAALGCSVRRSAVAAVVLGVTERRVDAAVLLKRKAACDIGAGVVALGIGSACCRPLDTAAAVVD